MYIFFFKWIYSIEDVERGAELSFFLSFILFEGHQVKKFVTRIHSFDNFHRTSPKRVQTCWRWTRAVVNYNLSFWQVISVLMKFFSCQSERVSS